MKRLYFLLVLTAIIFSAFGLTGCISSVGKEYFQLYLPRHTPPAASEEASYKIDKILLVDSVEVDEVYDDYRIVYRTSPYHLNYYSYKYWIKKPGLMVRDSIVDYFSKNNVFKKVITGFAEGEPDLIMKTVVHVLEEYDRPETWFAHLKMDIKMEDFKTGEPVLFHTFDREWRLIQKKVAQFPIGISRLLQEELDKAINKYFISFNKNRGR